MNRPTQQQLIRELMFEDIYAEVGRSPSAVADVSRMAPSFLKRYPGSGLTAEQIARAFSLARFDDVRG